MIETFYVETLANGLTLLGQPMKQVSSAAMTVMLPSGSATDPAGAEGSAAVGLEWLMRGAGDRDTRALNDALDNLGCQHSERVHSETISLSAALLGRHVPRALEIYADVLQRPRLGDEQFEPCRQLTLQDLESLEDEPSRKCNVLLRERFYPQPYGRCVYGTAESLTALSAEAVRTHLRRTLSPAGAIMAFAGNIQWDDLVATARRLFGDWDCPPPPAIPSQPGPGGITQICKNSAQTHLALAHRAAPLDHPLYYPARLAQTILSGGMSSRLFTEVREKRGLAYHVSTRYHAIKGCAGMFTYAGTRPDLAQQTFDLTIAELQRIGEGIESDELQRAKVQARSSLVMQGESTSARSTTMASDWYHLGRLRGLQEISDALDAVTERQVLDCVHAFPAEQFTVLTIGAEPVDASAATKGNA